MNKILRLSMRNAAAMKFGILRPTPVLATKIQPCLLVEKRQNYSSSVQDSNKWFQVESRDQYSLDTKQLKELLAKDEVFIIDVRESDEVAAGRLPAKRFLHIPIGLFIRSMKYTDEKFLETYGVPKPQKGDKDIVFACKIGLRSTFALQLAQSWGYSLTRHYRDGWDGWQKEA